MDVFFTKAISTFAAFPRSTEDMPDARVTNTANSSYFGMPNDRAIRLTAVGSFFALRTLLTNP
jgi:hypothetical protein